MRQRRVLRERDPFAGARMPLAHDTDHLVFVDQLAIAAGRWRGWNPDHQIDIAATSPWLAISRASVTIRTRASGMLRFSARRSRGKTGYTGPVAEGPPDLGKL